MYPKARSVHSRVWPQKPAAAARSHAGVAATATAQPSAPGRLLQTYRRVQYRTSRARRRPDGLRRPRVHTEKGSRGMITRADLARECLLLNDWASMQELVVALCYCKSKLPMRESRLTSRA